MTRRLGRRLRGGRAMTARRCKKVEHLIYISEYKRFQSAPGTAADASRLLAGPPLSDRQPLARPKLSQCPMERSVEADRLAADLRCPGDWD